MVPIWLYHIMIFIIVIRYVVFNSRKTHINTIIVNEWVRTSMVITSSFLHNPDSFLLYCLYSYYYCVLSVDLKYLVDISLEQ